MKKKLQWLEVMRAAAACWVLLHHANLSASYFVGSLGWGKQFVANGYLGVDFFFVLSGFIIAFSSNRLLERGKGFSDYAKARISRIYVPYLPIGIGMYLLYLLLPALSDGNRTPGLLTSLTLLPSVNPPALSVAWPLQAGDVPDTEADISELIASVDYRPQVGVEEGVANFVRWYKEYNGVAP